MANIRKYSLGFGVMLVSLLAGNAVAVPLSFGLGDRIYPDTKLTGVDSAYNANTNIFTQTHRLNGSTEAEYRQEANADNDNVTDLTWSLTAEIDEAGNLVLGTGYFELFGAINFADPSKTDIVIPQVLLSGGIRAFGVEIFEAINLEGDNSNFIQYNILGLAIDSAPGIDYNGYLGMIWTDDPSSLAGGGPRRNNAELWGSDWQTEAGNITQAQADIFVVPAPSSILLFGLAFIGLLRNKRNVIIS